MLPLPTWVGCCICKKTIPCTEASIIEEGFTQETRAAEALVLPDMEPAPPITVLTKIEFRCNTCHE